MSRFRQVAAILTAGLLALPLIAAPSQAAAPAPSKVTAAAVNPFEDFGINWSGEFLVGNTLTVEGRGVPNGTFAFQWLRNDVRVSTAASYKIVAADAGSRISVKVTATYAGKSVSQTTFAEHVYKDFADSVPTVTLTGEPMVGNSLLIKLSHPEGPGIYWYHWFINGQQVGSTSRQGMTLHATPGDQYRVEMTVRHHEVNTIISSNAVTVIPNPVANLATPIITGTAKVGSTLATVGRNAGSANAIYSYVWLRNGTAITKPSRTASYVVAAADFNTRLSVQATASVYGQGASKMSVATAVVSSGTITKTKSAYTSGTYRYGHTIKANVGSWSPSGNHYTYRWLKNGASISGATKSSYKLPKSIKGKYISVKVTVSRAGYTTTSSTSSKHKVK